MRKGCLTGLALIILLVVGSITAYYLPPLHDHLAWRVDVWSARVKYWLQPPDQIVFVPKGQESTPTSIPVAIPTRRATPTIALTRLAPTTDPTQTPTATPISTPLPSKNLLTGITWVGQKFNNCGPANLVMALNFWGWNATQAETAAYLKPNPRDKNVMPYEMLAYVQEKTQLHGIVRVGGDLQTLKSFIAAGFPVIVEKGFEGQGFDGWMGHYEVVHGFDDTKQRFNVQDSYYGPNLTSLTYDSMLENWRAFNYLYMVVYPPQLEPLVLNILGSQADVNSNYQFAADKAAQETQSLDGRDKFFAWFNRGASLVGLKDYAGAATAYDAAFALYASLDKDKRPWRILWYQTGPYFAYYYTQRYQDVIDLANTTLNAQPDPILEESFYWRALAEAALGHQKEAVADFRKSIEVHPGFTPAIEQLQKIGIKP